MFGIIGEALIGIAGVLLAPLIAQSLFKPKTSVGKVATALSGVGLVLAYLLVWSIYQKDPLQLAFCSATNTVLAKPLPACAPPEAPKPPVQPKAITVQQLLRRWRRPDDAECAHPLEIKAQPPHIKVTLGGTEFVETVEEPAGESLSTVVISPEPVRGQRFKMRLVDGQRVLEITPVYGGSPELWYRCEP